MPQCCSDLCQCSPEGTGAALKALTSRAFTGQKITSSGSPAARAASSTGEGCGLLRFPRPLGLPGWVTTPATCAAARSKVVLCLENCTPTQSDATTSEAVGQALHSFNRTFSKQGAAWNTGNQRCSNSCPALVLLRQRDHCRKHRRASTWKDASGCWDAFSSVISVVAATCIWHAALQNSCSTACSNKLTQHSSIAAQVQWG